VTRSQISMHSSLVSQVCCSVLQCVAMCCSVLQCVAVCCSRYLCIQGGGLDRKKARDKDDYNPLLLTAHVTKPDSRRD